MTISEAVERFLEGYFGTNTRDPKTKSGYALDLEHFADFAGPETLLIDIRPETLEAWATLLQARPYATASIRRKFAAVKVFLNYWVRRGAISTSPMWQLRLSLRKEKVLPRSLSPSDSQLLIEQAWRGHDTKTTSKKILHRANHLYLRNIAIIETLFATGIRVGELIKLRLSDWQEEERSFLIQGKGSRERLAFLPDERSIKAVKAYLEVRQRTPADTDSVFLNAIGKPIKVQGVAMILARIAKDAGIAKE